MLGAGPLGPCLGLGLSGGLQRTLMESLSLSVHKFELDLR